MMKKLDKDIHNHKIILKLNPKTLNIRQSIRKKLSVEKDPLINVDLHSLFVENFKVNFIYL
jgi:hypothetical protein